MSGSVIAAVGYAEEWYIQILKSVILFGIAVQIVPIVLLAERKLLGRFQHRYGPNRVGPFGAAQPLADIVKLATKEDFRPSTSVGFLYTAAPIISLLTALAAFAIIPFGDVATIFGEEVGLYGLDVGIGVLYVFAFGAIAFYGLMLGGWASGSKYSFLGAMRAAAQLISYEVAMGLSLVGVIMMAGSLSLPAIVEAQDKLWYALILAPSFVIYVISMVGETNRAPFDLPEAEGELVGGFHTEYSSLKFALFFLAEYINMATVSALATTLFLGGWHAPWPINVIWDGANSGYWPLLWFFGKVFIFVFLFVWLRGSLPRMRYDQFMALGWKVLIPVSLAWIVAVAFIRKLRSEDMLDQKTLIWAAVAAGVLLLLTFLIPEKKPEPEAPAPETASESGEPDAFAGGYPVPPMPEKVDIPKEARR